MIIRNGLSRHVKILMYCIGHPTGRLVGKREPYPLDIHQLVAAAKANGTLLEINAQPDRIDLTDEYAAIAVREGVKLVISTDSHKASDFQFMKLRLYVARRAWYTRESITNTRSSDKLKRLMAKKRLSYA